MASIRDKFIALAKQGGKRKDFVKLAFDEGLTKKQTPAPVKKENLATKAFAKASSLDIDGEKKTEIFKNIGNFSCNVGFFERIFADKYYKNGLNNEQEIELIRQASLSLVHAKENSAKFSARFKRIVLKEGNASLIKIEIIHNKIIQSIKNTIVIIKELSHY